MFDMKNIGNLNVIYAAVATGILTIIGIVIGHILKNRKEKGSATEVDLSNKQAIWLTEKLSKTPDIDAWYGDKIIIHNILSINAADNRCVAITGIPGTGKRLACRIALKNMQKKVDNIGYIEFNHNMPALEQFCTKVIGIKKRGNSEKNIVEYFNKVSGISLLFLTGISTEQQLADLEKIYNLIGEKATIIITTSLSNVIINGSRITQFEMSVLDFKTAKDLYNCFGGFSSSDRQLNKILNLSGYIPLLVIALAEVTKNADKVQELLRNVERSGFKAITEHDIYDYNNATKATKRKLKTLLEITYNVNALTADLKTTLAVLAFFYPLTYTDKMFEWFSIDKRNVARLSFWHWLKRDNVGRIEYAMQEFQYRIIEALEINVDFEYLLTSVYDCFSKRDNYINLDFKDFWFYAEKIRENYSETKHSNYVFQWFASEMADRCNTEFYYRTSKKWADLFCADEPSLAAHQAFVYLKVYGQGVEKEELKNLASKAREVAINAEHPDLIIDIDVQEMLYSDYKDEESLACAEKILKHPELSEENKIISYHHIVKYYMKNKMCDEIASTLSRIPQELFSNDSRYCAWLCFSLSDAYKTLKNNDELSDSFKQQGLIKANKRTGFCSEYTKNELQMTDLALAEYMHSIPVLCDDLQAYLKNEDAEALYIEGRYLENKNDVQSAFEHYQKAMEANSECVRAICALGKLLYDGKHGINQDLFQAERLWLFCVQREHAGSHYWLSKLYFEDETKSKEYLKKAYELGSNKARIEIEAKLDELKSNVQEMAVTTE